jgi:hypothetical protein
MRKIIFVSSGNVGVKVQLFDGSISLFPYSFFKTAPESGNLIWQFFCGRNLNQRKRIMKLKITLLLLGITAVVVAVTSFDWGQESALDVKTGGAIRDTVYCVELKDGITTVTIDGREIFSDLTLKDGTKIKTNGTVIKPDGTETVLEPGRCIDQAGNLTVPVQKTE